ncbi:hypothetical protein TNCV_1176161 [Trichonephila clavipes]|nr:hypothetical protein TNCV_1176161 [Trichonephila clavipes]
MDRWGRNDKIFDILRDQAKENRFGKTYPRLGASPDKLNFEKRVIQRCYNFLPDEILNAVQTRSQVKAAREERGIDSGDAKKGEDEVIIVSSDAEDEILIPALQEYVPELALRFTRENLIDAQKIARRLNRYEQAASQVQVTNQVFR